MKFRRLFLNSRGDECMTYGYCRCSTDETKQDIVRQERELISMGVSKSNIFTEYTHGTDRDRVELNRLLATIGVGDTIVATELSRITRSIKDLIEILEIVKEKRVKIILGGFTCDCSQAELDPMTEGMLKMMGVFSEMERNIISQRVKSGMKNAKAKGKQIGRPEITADTIPDKFKKHYQLYTQGKLNVSDLARLTEYSRTTTYKYIELLK